MRIVRPEYYSLMRPNPYISHTVLDGISGFLRRTIHSLGSGGNTYIVRLVTFPLHRVGPQHQDSPVTRISERPSIRPKANCVLATGYACDACGNSR